MEGYNVWHRRFQDRSGHIWVGEREDSIVTVKWAAGVDLGDNWGLISSL